MKKLMFGLAAMVAGSVMAIESDNIVGYNTDTLAVESYRMVGPSFSSVGSDGKMLLKNLVFGTDVTGDKLFLINKDTLAQTELMWVSAEDAEGIESPDGAGWYKDNGDDTFTYMGNESVECGCGFWLYPINDKVDVVASGEVMKTFSRVFPVEMYGAFANPFPMTKKLKDFSWSQTEASGDKLILINKQTAKQEELMWVTAEDAEGIESTDGAGWYKDNGDDTFTYRGNDELTAGQGCWIYPINGAATLSGTL